MLKVLLLLRKVVIEKHVHKCGGKCLLLSIEHRLLKMREFDTWIIQMIVFFPSHFFELLVGQLAMSKQVCFFFLCLGH